MHQIRVGELYTKGRTSWPESVEWNWMPTSNELRLFFRDPQPQEIQAVKRGNVEFALVVEQDIILLLFRFLPADKGQRGVQWSDAPYSYHMVPQDRRGLPPEHIGKDERLLLQIVLVNATTGIVLAIRMVSFSPAFTEKMYQAIRAQAAQPFDQVAYDRHLRRLYATYDSTHLVKRAIITCTGGE